MLDTSLQVLPEPETLSPELVIDAADRPERVSIPSSASQAYLSEQHQHQGPIVE